MDGMHPFGRVVFAGLAVFVAWMLFRALRSGRIYARGVEFRLDDQPIMFSLAILMHIFAVGFSAWCAAGYDPRSFFEGLGFSYGAGSVT